MLKTRKEITLPSGGTCVIRKLSPLDLSGLPVMPQAFPQEGESKRPVDENRALQYGLSVSRAILSKCVSKISYKDGDRLVLVKIVDKDFGDCGTNEISVEEVEQEDANMIVKEVMELSNMTKEAGQEAAPFREEQAPADDPARSG